ISDAPPKRINASEVGHRYDAMVLHVDMASVRPGTHGGETPHDAQRGRALQAVGNHVRHKNGILRGLLQSLFLKVVEKTRAPSYGAEIEHHRSQHLRCRLIRHRPGMAIFTPHAYT